MSESAIASKMNKDEPTTIPAIAAGCINVDEDVGPVFDSRQLPRASAGHE
jgi:hypothetical protein